MDRNLTVCYSRCIKSDFLIALKLCRSDSSILIIARDPFPMLFFDVLRGLKNRVFIAIQKSICIHEIVSQASSFTAIALSGLHLSNFEFAFLDKYCKKHCKKIVVLVRKSTGLPFLDEIAVEHVSFSEVFYKDYW